MSSQGQLSEAMGWVASSLFSSLLAPEQGLRCQTPVAPAKMWGGRGEGVVGQSGEATLA